MRLVKIRFFILLKLVNSRQIFVDKIKYRFETAKETSDDVSTPSIPLFKITSVLAYWHLAKYFWLLLPFYATIKETAVISYGKTKKIQNQTYG